MDRQPLGDMIESLIVMMVGHPDVEFTYQHERDDHAFHWSTLDWPDELIDMPRCSPAVMDHIRKELHEGIKALEPSVLNERSK